MENFVFTDELKAAYSVLENSTEHLFLTGKAGTGKSTLLKYFIANSNQRVALLAPTGLSALNIGGQTIHSFFMFPPQLIDRGCIRSSPKQIYRKLDVIVIDEASMIRADILDGIDLFMRVNGKNRKLPFGGTRIILVGDLFQLPPVVTNTERNVYDELYDTPYFFSSKVFGKVKMSLLELKTVFRQKDNTFISILNEIRHGKAGNGTLSVLNKRVFTKELDRVRGPYIALTSTNKVAAMINRGHLNRIKEPSQVYEAIVTGNIPLNEMNLPIDLKLELKPGARVIFTKNDSNRQWVNGSMGIVNKVLTDRVFVDIKDEYYTGKVCVERESWDKVSYAYNSMSKTVEPRVMGSVRQIPLRLAYSVTIHKGQGCTFDRVYLDTTRDMFAHGQMYVALSRCTSLKGLVLRYPMKESNIIVDERIVEFNEKMIKPIVETRKRVEAIVEK